MNNDVKRLSRIAKAIGAIRKSETMHATLADAARLQRQTELDDLTSDETSYPLISALFPEFKVRLSARLSSEIATLQSTAERNSASAARHDYQLRRLTHRQSEEAAQHTSAIQKDELLEHGLTSARNGTRARLRQAKGNKIDRT